MHNDLFYLLRPEFIFYFSSSSTGGGGSSGSGSGIGSGSGSGSSSSIMTPLCKWPITLARFLSVGVRSRHRQPVSIKRGSRYMGVCDSGHRKMSVVRIKRVNFRENTELFVWTNETVRNIQGCP